MKVFSFKRPSGEFAGAVFLGPGDIAPLTQDHFLIPGDCTVVEPPVAGEREAAVWDSGVWRLVADHRGETWYLPDGRPVQISALGNPAERLLSPTQPRLTLRGFALAIARRLQRMGRK